MRESLLFVPGFNCDADLWAPQIAEFSRAFDCCVADHTRFDTMRGIAEGILRDAPERFILCGLSMGGYLAFEIMRLAPERVTKLALLDTQATPETDLQRKLRNERIEAGRRDGMEAVSDLIWPTLVHPTRREDAPLRAIVRGMALKGGIDVFLRQAKAIMNRADSRPDLAKIRVPTLVLTGEQDALTPPSRAREMADAIAGSRLVIVPDCGHMSTLEAPLSVNAALGSFLA